MDDNWNFEGLTQDILVKSDGSCCCGSSFPDTSKIENPANPIDFATPEFFKDFEVYLKQLGIIDLGYVKDIPDQFKDKFGFSSAIVISYEISQAIHDVGAGSKAQEYNDDLYRDFGNLTYRISDYLRLRGFKTEIIHPSDNSINFSMLAQDAGIGYIGKSRLFISPNMGPNLKIAAILVNIKNLPEDKNSSYEWISEYCNYCNSCVKACPQDCIILDKQNNTVSFIDELCIGCTEGCTECIKACPFYKRGYGPILKKYEKIKDRKK